MKFNEYINLLLESDIVDKKIKAGYSIQFDYVDAEDGQNPFVSILEKAGAKYKFSPGRPANGSMIYEPVYPLVTNYTFPNIDVVVGAIKKQEEDKKALTKNFKWIPKKTEEDYVEKVITKNGKKHYVVFVDGNGFYQMVTDFENGIVRYYNTNDLKSDVESPRMLTKDMVKKIDYTIPFNKETYEKNKHL